MTLDNTQNIDVERQLHTNPNSNVQTHYLHRFNPVKRFHQSRLISKLIALITISYAFFFLLVTIYSHSRFSVDSDFSPSSYLSLGFISDSSKHDQQIASKHFSPENGIILLKKHKAKYEFSWSHWVNLTELNSPLPTGQSKFTTYTSRRFDKPPASPGTTAELRRLGQTYLANYASPVAKIIFLGKTAKDKVAILTPNEKFNGTYQKTVYKVYNEIEQLGLLPPLDPNIGAESTPDRVLIFPDESTFHLDLDKLTKVDQKNSNLEPKFHANEIQHTLDILNKTPKFFHELWLNRDAYLGVHYDWRFFRQIRFDDDATQTLHHLIRTWATFTHNEGIISWLAHGVLLGWHWNGLTMPWDADLDVQIPILELDRIARKYNNTLIIQDPIEGDGRYLLEVSPTYIQRVKGNGNNVIDARFIDIRSGMYLDITGIANNHPSDSALVGCKSPHYYRPEDLYPLRLSTYEGSALYVPNNVRSVLRDEYRSFDRPVFTTHRYNKDLRLWVNSADCMAYQNDSLKYTGSSSPNQATQGARASGIEQDKGELTYYGACENTALWTRYNRTRFLTELHYEELSYLKMHQNEHSHVTKDKAPSDKYIWELSKFGVTVKPMEPNPRYIEGE